MSRSPARSVATWLHSAAVCLLSAAAWAQPASYPAPGRPPTVAQAAADGVPAASSRGVPAADATAAASPSLDLAGFRLTGISPEQARSFLPLLDKYRGSSRTLADLEAAVGELQAALQRSGLFLAQVYMPAQDVADGIVTLAVLEGRLGAIRLEAGAGVRVSRARIEEVIAPLRGNPVAERDRIERALFTLRDLRGLSADSSLTPGERAGYADLTITIAATPPFAYSVEADNGGSIFTGRYRLSGTVEWASPTGRGDVAALNALTSTNGGVRSLGGSWLTPLDAEGTKAGIAATFLQYKLGTPTFEPLDANGSAGSVALQLLHPVVRSANRNVILQASVERRKSDDRVDAIQLVTRKGWTSYITLGATGDFRDAWGGGGVTTYSSRLVAGRLSIDSAADYEADQSPTGYRSAGAYSKLVLAASRLQALPVGAFLYLSAAAQAAQKNLDTSEKFNLGGSGGVRGYPAAESPSDSGAIVTWEFRKPLRAESLQGEFVLSLFGDYGIGRMHHHPLPSDTGNVRRLVSHGIGMTFAEARGWHVRAQLAACGGAQAQSDDSRARLLVQAGRQF